MKEESFKAGDIVVMKTAIGNSRKKDEVFAITRTKTDGDLFKIQCEKTQRDFPGWMGWLVPSTLRHATPEEILVYRGGVPEIINTYQIY